MAELGAAAFWFFATWFVLFSFFAVPAFLGSRKLTSLGAKPIQITARLLIGMIGGLAYASIAYLLIEGFVDWKWGADPATPFWDGQTIIDVLRNVFRDEPILWKLTVTGAIFGMAIRTALDWKGKAT
ncbi:hypothetical protein [Rhodalgimonas zhirmunskyi]|uniref:Uncharacterized protein n=1 Tax=Rhodalgimonas zhirmunskyi TaxID=2964767 RepID=A0AAJ1X728_9RHOB|nr:hypothetical protein [Rhodoalgimonas zhirmunskyi]MDQ2094102.1 hypothetical protein [Rhodoalgimonas zhirmunskyi]